MLEEEKIITIIDKEITDISSLRHWVVSISTSYVNILRLKLLVLKYLVNEKGMHGVITCIERPFEYQLKIFEKNKIDAANIYFIDMITHKLSTVLPEHQTARNIENNNVIYLDSFFDLDKLIATIRDVSGTLRDENPDIQHFLLIDSIASIQIYNSIRSTELFIQQFIEELQRIEVHGLLILLENEMDPLLLDMLKSKCNKNIEIE